MTGEQTDAGQLFVFGFDGGDETDAMSLHNEQAGCGCDVGHHEIVKCRDDLVIKIWCTPDGKIAQDCDDFAALAGRTCAEWLRLQSRGMLCTRNY